MHFLSSTHCAGCILNAPLAKALCLSRLMLNQSLVLDSVPNSCSDSKFSFSTSSCCLKTGIEDEELHNFYFDSKDLNKNLSNFLLTYRNTPHSTTSQTPAVMMYNRTLRSKLHMLTPQDKEKVENLQADKQQQEK